LHCDLTWLPFFSPSLQSMRHRLHHRFQLFLRIVSSHNPYERVINYSLVILQASNAAFSLLVHSTRSSACFNLLSASATIASLAPSSSVSLLYSSRASSAILRYSCSLLSLSPELITPQLVRRRGVVIGTEFGGWAAGAGAAGRVGRNWTDGTDGAPWLVPGGVTVG